MSVSINQSRLAKTLQRPCMSSLPKLLLSTSLQTRYLQQKSPSTSSEATCGFAKGSRSTSPSISNIMTSTKGLTLIEYTILGEMAMQGKCIGPLKRREIVTLWRKLVTELELNCPEKARILATLRKVKLGKKERLNSLPAITVYSKIVCNPGIDQAKLFIKAKESFPDFALHYGKYREKLKRLNISLKELHKAFNDVFPNFKITKKRPYPEDIIEEANSKYRTTMSREEAKMSKEIPSSEACLERTESPRKQAPKDRLSEVITTFQVSYNSRKSIHRSKDKKNTATKLDENLLDILPPYDPPIDQVYTLPQPVDWEDPSIICYGDSVTTQVAPRRNPLTLLQGADSTEEGFYSGLGPVLSMNNQSYLGNINEV